MKKALPCLRNEGGRQGPKIRNPRILFIVVISVGYAKKDQVCYGRIQEKTKGQSQELRFLTPISGTMMKLKRRKFLEVAAGIGIGAVVTGCTKGGQKLTKGIPLRQLGRTDLQLTPVGFGAQHTRDSELIRYAIDQRINYIETAWGYGFGQPGNSCESIGKAISGVRDNVCLFVAYIGTAPRTSKAWVDNQFEQTLRDLATDYIDVFLWHQPDSIDMITQGEHIDLMKKWRSDGKIRWCGITAHENQEVYLEHLAESSLYDVAVVAFNCNSSPELAQSIEEAGQKGRWDHSHEDAEP